MINYISKPFKWFFKLEAASGLILLIAAILALMISNSSLSELYFSSLEKYLFIGINEFGLKLSVHHWINDALMAIFFFCYTRDKKRISSRRIIKFKTSIITYHSRCRRNGNTSFILCCN